LAKLAARLLEGIWPVSLCGPNLNDGTFIGETIASEVALDLEFRAGIIEPVLFANPHVSVVLGHFAKLFDGERRVGLLDGVELHRLRRWRRAVRTVGGVT